MSTSNIGEQLITFAYGNPALSVDFNRLNYQLHTPGIYDGGELGIESTTTVNIPRFVTFLVDSATAVGMRVQTTQSVSLDVSDTSKPYVAIFFKWNNQFANYADITTASWADIGEDWIILGKCEYNGSGELVDFDLTRRSQIENSDNRSLLPFWVKSNEPVDNNVVVNGGRVLHNSDSTNYTGEQTVGPFSDTTDGRIDLLDIDSNGNLAIEEGTDSATPQVPSYEGKFVLAHVSRGAGRTTVQGSDILNRPIDASVSLLEGVTVDDGEITIDSLTPDRIVYTDSNKTLRSIDDLRDWIQGTNNQVNIVPLGDSTIQVALTPYVTIDGIILDTIEEATEGEGVLFPDTLRANDIRPELDDGTTQFTGNFTITGDLTVSGTTTTIDTATITTQDNLIIINEGEAGNGVSAGSAGIQVDRGTAIDYHFIFDEVNGETFRVGTIYTRLYYESISGDFEVGELIVDTDDTAEAKVKAVSPNYLNVSIRRGEFVPGMVFVGQDSGASAELTSDAIIEEFSDTQAVATREDTPVEFGVPYWNQIENRFDTISDLYVDNGRLIANEGVTLGMASTAVAGTIRWNATEVEFQGYDGTEWGSIGGGMLEIETRNLVTRPNLDEGAMIEGDATDNLIIGYDAAHDLGGGIENIVVGNNAGYKLYYGERNTLIGVDAGYGITNTTQNLAIGYQAFYTGGEITASPGEGENNVAIGMSSLYSNTTGQENIAIGTQSGYYITSGYGNFFGGNSAGQFVTEGSENVAVGDKALLSSLNTGEKLTGGSNVAVGAIALFKIESTAQYNTSVGRSAGENLTTGESNVFLGSYSGTNQTTNSDLLIIDNQDRGTAAAEETDSLLYGKFDPDTTLQYLNVNGALNAKYEVVVGDSVNDTTGAIRFNPTEEEFQGYDGTEWAPLGGTGFSEDTTYPSGPTPGEIVYRTDLGIVAIYTSDGWIQI